jgi:hypothetical protein
VTTDLCDPGLACGKCCILPWGFNETTLLQKRAAPHSTEAAIGVIVSDALFTVDMTARLLVVRDPGPAHPDSPLNHNRKI